MAHRDLLHNAWRSVISRVWAACCVVCLVNSQLLTAKRRLASHPDRLGKFWPELCRRSLDHLDRDGAQPGDTTDHGVARYNGSHTFRRAGVNQVAGLQFPRR